MNKYYVYALCYPDGEPFYIGKGQGKRIDCHEREVKRKEKTSPYKQAVIRQIQATGQQIGKQIIADFASELDAYMYEWALINLTTYSDNLTNVQYSTVKFVEAHKRAELLAAQLPKDPEKPKEHEEKDMPPQDYGVREVANLINRDLGYLLQLIRKGKLVAYRTNATKTSPYRIKQEDLDTFVQTYKFQPRHSRIRKEDDPLTTNYISISEAAKQLDVHPTTLLRAIKAKELEAMRLGKSYRVSEQALQAYIDRKTIKVGGNIDGNQSA